MLHRFLEEAENPLATGSHLHGSGVRTPAEAVPITKTLALYGHVKLLVSKNRETFIYIEPNE